MRRERHRAALRQAAMSGARRHVPAPAPKPPPTRATQNACGCAGVMTAAITLDCLHPVFDPEFPDRPHVHHASQKNPNIQRTPNDK